MKKSITAVLCFAFCMALMLAFAACGNNNDTTDSLPDFKDCEIGYRLEVYPKVAFRYELSDGTIVNITSIEATLVAKNTINEGDTIYEPFGRYLVTLNITGFTNTRQAGKNISVSCSNLSASGVINEDGSFILSTINNLPYNSIVYFHSVTVY